MRRLAVIALCILSAGCASTTPPKSQPSPRPASTASSTSLPAFEAVVQGAQPVAGTGPLKIWFKQHKYWLELGPEDWHRPLFLSPQLTQGVGEQGFYGGVLMSRWNDVGRPQWTVFRQVHQQVQLLAINGAFSASTGKADTSSSQAFSHSLLASAPVLSAPHPQRQTILVDFTAMMGSTDVLGLGLQLQRAFRQSYALDARNTALTHVPGSQHSLMWDVAYHFATSTISSNPADNPSALSRHLPDPRSLFLSVRYTLSPLPQVPMQPRPADPRVGFFTTTVNDVEDLLARSPRKHWINRWPMQPQDPALPTSSPVRPLVFWLDQSIPKAYRSAIKAGILEWNKAFEAIGLTDVLQVKEDAVEQPVDTVGNGHIIVRWLNDHAPRFSAIGPSHVDPRSGEILASNIAFQSLTARAMQTLKREILPNALEAATEAPASPVCEHAALAAEQLAYGLAVSGHAASLEELASDDTTIEAFVHAYLKSTAMHEVGHVLGLRHNFKASRWRSPAELARWDLTESSGLSASVMDYPAINIGPSNAPWGTPFQTTLGPYDYWAIAYGYKPLPEDAQAQQRALEDMARKQASSAWSAALDYGSDEEQAQGLDPQALTFDLGNDPLVFAQHRWDLAKHMLQRQAMLHPDQNAAMTMAQTTLRRRLVLYAYRDMARVSTVVLRQVGGLITRRDSGDSGRALLEPLSAAAQQAALSWLLQHSLSPQHLWLPPTLQQQLATDYLDRTNPGSGEPAEAVAFSLNEQWAMIYKDVLQTLMSERLAIRMLDNQNLSSTAASKAWSWPKLMDQLQTHIWADAASRAQEGQTAMDAMRRDLQTSHVNHLAEGLTKGRLRADTRAVYRQQAQDLLQRLRNPLHSKRWSTQERIHRQDCAATLAAALQATWVRALP